MRVFFLSMCSVKCLFMNIALDHQMKALMNKKKFGIKRSERWAYNRHGGYLFFNQMRKK